MNNALGQTASRLTLRNRASKLGGMKTPVQTIICLLAWSFAGCFPSLPEDEFGADAQADIGQVGLDELPSDVEPQEDAPDVAADTANCLNDTCECDSDADCSDGDLCNGTERCTFGRCGRDTDVVQCAASSAQCLENVCNPSTGSCELVPASGTCDDGNACTQQDVCKSGVCVGEEPVICEAPQVCSAPGTCNPSNGLCSSPTIVANDTPCARDSGDAGRCDGGSCLAFPSVSAGFDHSCAITPVGKVTCWGANKYSQLGRGTSATTAIGDGAGPSVAAAGYLPSIDGARTVTAGADGTCIVSASRGFRCWGYAGEGGNGVSDRSSGSSPPNTDTPLGPGFSTITALSRAGHACALSDSGRISCWGGRNDIGEHGNGTATGTGQSPTILDAKDVPPVQFRPSDVAQAIVTALSDRFTITGRGVFYTGFNCAVIEAMGVICWGDNSNGQLGVGDTLSRGGAPTTIPALIPPAWPTFGPGRDPRPIVSLCAGRTHACAIQDGVGLRCWGDNTYGQLGYTEVDSIGVTDVPLDHPPVSLGSGRIPVSVGCGETFTCVLMVSGEVVCFGSNINGRLGLGLSVEALPNTRELGPANLEPVRLGAMVHSLAVGYRHTCAVTVGGLIRCWGNNESGRLGVGHTNDIGDAASEMPPAAVVLP